MKQYQIDKEQFISDLQGLLRIKSVRFDCGPETEKAPLGQGIYDAIEYMLYLGRRFGFRTKNVDGYCGWIEMGEGDRMVGIIAHVDTVPVESEGWIAPPFDGTVIDGRIYGRGTSDDKGPAMVALYAMKAVADSGVKLDKRVRLILGGDEEAGEWSCMKRYRQTEELPSCAFTPDAEYPTTYAEKGILHVRISAALDAQVKPISLICENAYNVVPAFASAVVDGVQYEAQGKAAHAMAPELGVNALLGLCGQLREKGVDHPFIKLCGIANAEGFGIAFSDEPSGKLTINPSIAKVDAQSAELRCDIRIPVTFTDKQVVEAIAEKVAPLGFTVENEYFQPPLYVEKDSPLVATLQRVYRDCTGREDEPVSTGGGTYARAFENAVAFGALFPDEEVTYHKTNENWNVENMLRNSYRKIPNNHTFPTKMDILFQLRWKLRKIVVYCYRCKYN